MIEVKRVDNQLFWNVMTGDECVGCVKVDEYKLIFKAAINAFAPELSYVKRMEAVRIARSELTDEEYAQIKCGGDLDLKDFISQFLGASGTNEDEVDEQAIAMIKGLKKKWQIRKITS